MQFNQELPEARQHHNYTVDKINTLEGYPQIKGYNFEQAFDFNEFVKAFNLTGFQATNIGNAITVIENMRREKATIFLGYTSNMISSGVRETIKFLVKHRFVDVLVTTAGGIEEDIIKTFKPFVLGSFDVPGRVLFEQGINRIGNIFVPNDRYVYFERFMNALYEKLYEEQISRKKIMSTRYLIQRMGQEVNHEDSVLYWAAKNNIPVFCPGLMDGSIGDITVFFKHNRPDFIIDITNDIQDITRIALNAEKTGVILLGGGIAKHYILNANLFREGADFAVYINTGQEFDGSDSGANISEAISWAKIKPNALAVKIHGDATIVFPLLVAATFKKEYDEMNKQRN